MQITKIYETTHANRDKQKTNNEQTNNETHTTTQRKDYEHRPKQKYVNIYTQTHTKIQKHI